MLIGIFETDLLDKPLLKTFGSYGQMFEKLLLNADQNLQFRYYQVLTGELPTSPSECDAWLMTGSKASVTESQQWINKLSLFIKKIHKAEARLVGICFGHQLIAKTLGGCVTKSDKGWGVGVHCTRVLKHRQWMSPSTKQFNLIVSHQDQVVKLPTDAENIFSTAFCEFSGFQIKNHILTFQGHPEFSVKYALNRIESRRHLISSQRYNTAIESYKNPADAPLVGKWLVEFLKH